MAPSGNSFATPKLWKEATVYQIYPASFLSTGSGSTPGWGDVRGITSKLDYLKNLGVDVVWTSPIYKSPQVDMGYDISDYKDIDPKYGKLEDVDDLIKGLKQRGMKLMMDLVVNHTSDQHAWFLESRSSKSSSKRDWYIWQPPKYDELGNRRPPNNWASILGPANSAWTWDETTQEYYLSLFTPEQPDLNWRTAEVKEAVFDVMRFWLDRGASGFRMDVINLISKVEGYPDAPITIPGSEWQPGHMHFANGPELHTYLKEMNRKVLRKYDTITVGEMPCVSDSDEILRVVGAESEELNMIFIFDLVDIDNSEARLGLRKWGTPELRTIVSHWQKVMQERDGWNSVFIENHDNPRSVSRYVDDSDQYRELGAKLLALMLTTLGGTLYVYQGEELGTRNLGLDVPVEEYKDIETINYWKKVQAEHAGDEKALQYAKQVIQRKARDHARTPVQWTNGPTAGFCPLDVKPWMHVNEDKATCNEAEQATSSSSVKAFWHRALQMRKQHKAVLVYGSFECLDEKHEDVFAYQRTSEAGEEFVVLLNFSGKDVEWSLPDGLKVEAWSLGNYEQGLSEKKTADRIHLRAWEGVSGHLSTQTVGREKL